MSFRVETSPKQYDDYQLFSATRFEQFGQHLFSLLNPNYAATATESESKDRHTLERPSDLCRPRAEQLPYYIADSDVVKQIHEQFIPHQSTFPYTPPLRTHNDGDEQMTNSITDWPARQSNADSNRHLLSQIVTIVQCRSNFVSSALGFESNEKSRHAVRLFISTQCRNQQMEAFLDAVNEALLLEPDTIQTLWDPKGDKVTSTLFLSNCAQSTLFRLPSQWICFVVVVSTSLLGSKTSPWTSWLYPMRTWTRSIVSKMFVINSLKRLISWRNRSPSNTHRHPLERVHRSTLMIVVQQLSKHKPWPTTTRKHSLKSSFVITLSVIWSVTDDSQPSSNVETRLRAFNWHWKSSIRPDVKAM